MDPILGFISGLLSNELTALTVLALVILLILFGWLVPKRVVDRLLAAERARGDAWEQLARTAQATLHETYEGSLLGSKAVADTAVGILKDVAPMKTDGTS